MKLTESSKTPTLVHYGQGFSPVPPYLSEAQTVRCSKTVANPPAGAEPSRSEHLAWCKKRALEYCEAGDVSQAFASMGSDLGKHPETANHGAIELGMMMLMSNMLSTPAQMRKFIEGFN